jgi:hypothetical protein
VDRSDEEKLVQNLVAADVACVEDNVDPREGLMHRGAKKSVRVRNETEPYHECAPGCAVADTMWLKARRRLA